MLRSMYSGISGMKNFQTKLDTIGNNIANVNTYGFKKGRVTFQDIMSQPLSGAQAPTTNDDDENIRGGLNPSQVGLGSKVGSIDTIHTQGSRQTTNRPLDLSLEGDGMFVLAEGGTEALVAQDEVDLQEVNTSFTRAGNFYLDSSGAIVNNDGKYLIGDYAKENGGDYELSGEAGIITIPDEAQSFSIQTDGRVNFVDQDGSPQVAGQIRLANFSNASGLSKLGGNTFQNTENAGISTDDGDFNDLDDLLISGQGGTGQMVAGALEMSNVDLADSFTEMITAQRGFQANTKIITTSDEILQELVNLKR